MPTCSKYGRLMGLAGLLFGLSSLSLVTACGGGLPERDPEAKPIPIHAKLSEYGFFKDYSAPGAYPEPVEGGIVYDLNTALFSDYALKHRTIHIPEGQAAYYRDQDVFEFPVGTIITKTFSFPADFRKTTENVNRIETRVLIHQPEGWVAIPYVWNAEQTDATPAYGGRQVAISFVDEEGQTQDFMYGVPSKNQCSSCHHVYKDGNTRKQVIVPIGPKARHINRDYEYPDGKENQLSRMERLGKLKGMPFFGNPPALPRMEDESVPVAERARAYMDINCAHCHNAKSSGGINSRMLLEFDQDNPYALGVCKLPGSAGKGGGGLRYDIVPGNPDESILHYRTATTDPGAMMPQIGRTLAHKEGAQLIYEWIKGMDVKDCSK